MIGKGSTALLGVCLLIAADAAAIPTAEATLVKGIPVSITTSAHGCASRMFTLRFTRPGARRAPDTGSAVLTLDTRTAELSGIERLVSRRGSLTLRWNAEALDPPAGGTIAGLWSTADGTGAYSGLHGRGQFSSDRTLKAVVYRGLVITAV